MENCTEQTDKTTDCTTKPPTLPSWKVNQIILTVVNLLSEEGYFREGFDYMEMIRKKGIVLKEYSAFKSENLLELQKVSIGLWNEGLCLIFPDPQTGATCRMIAYNDNKSAAEVMHRKSTQKKQKVGTHLDTSFGTIEPFRLQLPFHQRREN